MTIEPPSTEGDPTPVNRGPYASRTGTPAKGEVRPSDALAANVRAYRVLRHMTQEDLAVRMTHLCHGWGRSTVSAAEGRGRNISVDELFGLAASFGVSIGQLFDPTGPDHSRRLSLNVGVTDRGLPRSIEPDLAQLWGAAERSCGFGRTARSSLSMLPTSFQWKPNGSLMVSRPSNGGRNIESLKDRVFGSTGEHRAPRNVVLRLLVVVVPARVVGLYFLTTRPCHSGWYWRHRPTHRRLP